MRTRNTCGSFRTRLGRIAGLVTLVAAIAGAGAPVASAIPPPNVNPPLACAWSAVYQLTPTGGGGLLSPVVGGWTGTYTGSQSWTCGTSNVNSLGSDDGRFSTRVINTDPTGHNPPIGCGGGGADTTQHAYDNTLEGLTTVRIAGSDYYFDYEVIQNAGVAVLTGQAYEISGSHQYDVTGTGTGLFNTTTCPVQWLSFTGALTATPL